MKHSNVLPALALSLVLGAPCVVSAQQTPATTTTQSTTAPGQATTTTTTTTAVRYRKLDDMKVVGANGDKIGEINEVLIDPSGKVIAVAVEAGGFLGMGDKDVIVGLDQLQLQGDHFVTSMTKEQMKALPQWKD